jgi:hypothetical protein
MSRQVRHRVTALVAGGLLLGAPLLAGGTANAEQVGEGGRQVVFAGGSVLGLSCRSRPDVESMTVPADTTVRVINHTGHSAQLRLGGTVQGRIQDGESTEVMFRRGTTAVLLSPACTLGDESTPLLVTAMPSSPATMPDPIPAPSEPSDTAAPTTDRGSPSASAGGSALPDSVSPAGPADPAPRGTTGGHASRSAGAPMVVQAMPQGGSASPRLIAGTTRGTGRVAPAFAGMPPGEHKRLLPDVPTIGLSQATDSAPPAVPPTDVAAAEPVAAMAPLPESEPIGLLAATALVCVLGVGAATIRAIVSQRASRTRVT